MMKCDNCGEKMRLLPWVLCSMPPQYVYECPACGAHKSARVKGYENNGEIFANFDDEEDGQNV